MNYKNGQTYIVEDRRDKKIEWAVKDLCVPSSHFVHVILIQKLYITYQSSPNLGLYLR